MKKAFLVLSICYASLVAIAAGAHAHDRLDTCNVEFNGDVAIKPDVNEVTTINDGESH